MLLLSLGFSTSSLGQPRITLIDPEIYLGKFPLSQKKIDFCVQYVNSGDSLLYLTQLKAFCPCIKTEFSTEALAPGDTAQFHVNYRFRSEGWFSYPIRIYYNSSDEDEYAHFNFVLDVFEKKEETVVDE